MVDRGMTEMIHFHELSKKGEDFLNNLLNRSVIVSQKIDGSSFGFRKTNEGTIEYFGRGGKKIDITKRAVMRLYEPIIEHIESLNLSFLPNNTEIIGEYFPKGLKPLIPIQQYPKNSFVLLQVKYNGNQVKNFDHLDRISDKLNVMRPPIMYRGELRTEQKKEIVDFVNMDSDSRIAKFKTQSFVKFILNLINPNYDLKINKDVLEGIVFLFPEEPSKKEYVLKIVDPLFTSTIISKKDSSKNNQKLNEYKLLLKNKILVFMRNNFDYLKNLSVNYIGDNSISQSFVNLINDFILNKKQDVINWKEFNEYEPFVKDGDLGELFELNPKFVSADIINISKKYFWVGDTYRFILSNFFNMKRRAGGLFNKQEKDEINKMINDIQWLLTNR